LSILYIRLPSKAAADGVEHWLALPCHFALASQAGAVPPDKVRVGAYSSLSDAGLYIAQDKGYFAEQGLAVEFVQVNTTVEMMTQLASGDLDGAIKSVCQTLKDEHNKSRLTFYYLLAEHFDKLGEFAA